MSPTATSNFCTSSAPPESGHRVYTSQAVVISAIDTRVTSAMEEGDPSSPPRPAVLGPASFSTSLNPTPRPATRTSAPSPSARTCKVRTSSALRSGRPIRTLSATTRTSAVTDAGVPWTLLQTISTPSGNVTPRSSW